MTLIGLYGYFGLAQPSYTANDIVLPYEGFFRAGTNLGIYSPWTDEQLADIAAGNDSLGVPGVGVKALRPALFGHFVERFGYDLRVPTYQYYHQLGLEDNTVIVGFPPIDQQDPTEYCPGVRSEMYANLYLDIWDNGQNGTPVNDDNYFALYMYKLVQKYGEYIRFWEIWNEPGFDFTHTKGWAEPGEPGNWWDNNPDPCDYKLHAPIFHFVRTLRISYEIIKTLQPNDYVTLSGVGYPSFLDAVLRNTDNPVDGSKTGAYPLRGGAYFDVLGYHSYPHFDGSLREWDNSIDDFRYYRHSDAAANGLANSQDDFQKVLDRYGYNGLTYPNKLWIITECNVPRKAFDEYLGSDEAHRNFMPKAIVQCMKNNIVQLHIYKIGEETSYDEADSPFDLMGLYKKLDGVSPYYPEPTQGGVAHHTASDELFGKRYDAQRTAAMALPPDVDGGAFKDDNGNYTYILWAVTHTDRSEEASANYSFPAALNTEKLIRREWDYSVSNEQATIFSANIPLTAEPVYLAKAHFSSSKNQGCAPMSVSFINESQQGNLIPRWSFEGGQPATSADSNPTVYYSNTGRFKVIFELIDNQGNTVISQQDYIEVDEAPQAAFESHVNGPFLFFTNTSTINADSYFWDFGDGITSNEAVPTHTYFNSGSYTVSLTAGNSCGSTTYYEVFDVVVPTTSKVPYTANDTIIPYEGLFRPGVNLGVYEGWSDTMLADLAAGNTQNGTPGAAVRSLRPILDEEFLEYWGYDIRVNEFQHYVNLDLVDNTLIIGFPSDEHQDPNYYCANEQSELFDNLYLDIWDNGENGTPVNDDNYFALYLYKTALLYKDYVKFWEIWNEPSFDYAGHGWKSPGMPGNWWDNNPLPCDYKLKAPIFHFVRLLRISYEIIKYVDPEDYVTLSGVAYSSFLDAVLRNTDNPQDGSTAPGYWKKGGAYFDVLGFHTYPHFDGSTSYYDVDLGQVVYNRHSDAAVQGIASIQDTFRTLLGQYGYDGQQYPEKHWIITEANLPRKAFGNYMGSSHAQRNYLSKAIIECMRNDILQLHVYKIGEESDYNNAQSEFEVMGLYKKLDYVPMYSQQFNEAGIAYKTTSHLLYGTHYDTQRSAQMALPADVDGAAFRMANGKYIYALWAKTRYDQSEWAEANYSFPSSMNLDQLYRRAWNYSQNNEEERISSQNIELTATPVFLMETSQIMQPPLSRFSANITGGCLPLAVQFSDESLRADRWEWSFPGGTPASSSSRNPSITYQEAGTFPVSLTTYNAAGEHQATYTSYIEVDEIRSSAFSYTTNGTWVHFTSEQGYEADVSFDWYFGDGYHTRAVNPDHFYFQNGVYDVLLVVSNGCGADSTIHTIDLQNPPVADFLPVVMTLCQPHRVRFLDLSASSPESWSWQFPGGSPEVSDLRNPVIEYAEAGTYQATLIVSNSVGSDTLRQTIHLSGAVEFDLELVLCPGASIHVNGNIYDEDNPVGTELFPNGSVLGCDSIVHVNLSFDQHSVHSIDELRCDNSGIWVNGTLYNAQNPSGTELIPGGSSNGCDSIVHINLQYAEPGVFYISELLCPEDGIIANGEVYNIHRPAGTEVLFGGSANGCDSLIHIDLQFYSSTQSWLTETWCPSDEQWINGTLYHQGNTQGTEVFNNITNEGCDSILYVQLSFYPPAEYYLTRSLCEGDQLIINGTLYDSNHPTGLETIPNGSAQGCDSLIYIQLTYNDHIDHSITASICEGESYQFGDELLTTSGIYTATYPSTFGCDSIVELGLTVIPYTRIYLDVNLCEGDEFNGIQYHADTTLITILPGLQVCDTLIYTSLHFFTHTEQTLHIGLCEGDTYQGQIVEHDTLLTYVLLSEVGCDSIVRIDIHMLPIAETYLFDTITIGGQVWVGDHAYSTTGIYVDTLIAANSCDSIVVLDLTVTDLVNSEELTIAQAFQLQAVPNPFLETVNIHFALAEADRLTIDLLDLHGRRLTRLAADRLFTSGDHQLRLDASAWPAGVYLCQLNSAEGSAVVKLVKAD